MMKQSLISIVCLLLIFLLTDCSPKAAEEIPNNTVDIEAEFYKNLAEDMCICTKGLVDAFKAQEQLSKEEKVEMKTELNEKIKSEAERAEFCIARLQEENSKGMREIKQDLSEAALKEYCPEFYYMSKIGRIR